MTKEVPIPDELKVLLPETNVAVVVVGSKAYEIFPLFEGQLEKVSKDVAKYFEEVFSPDRKCPTCGKVVKEAEMSKIVECPACKVSLDDVRKSQIEAILGS